MELRTVDRADVDARRVLVRNDFNVPLEDGRVTDDLRIRASLPTLRWLVEHRARVVCCSHLGRPRGKRDERYSLEPVAAVLGERLGLQVTFVDDVAGDQARRAVVELDDGEVLLLQNLRFEPGEEQNDPALAERLAALAELYVDDAFGAAHRAHASVVGVAERLPAYAGFLLAGEVKELLRQQGQRAREYYRKAAEGLPRRDARHLLAAEIMGAIYRGILTRIERSDYDVFSRVVRIPRPRRALIAAATWARTAVGLR